MRRSIFTAVVVLVFHVHVPASTVEFLDRYCLECHRGEDAEGGARLDQLQPAEPGRRNRQLWSLVARNIESRRMPPEEAEQPSDRDREQIVLAIRAGLNNCDCSGPVDPGHVPPRRLTRYEYRRTIRDLLGIDYQPAADFPADDVGYGFDNVGDVLTVSPLLVEKYLTAAEEIAQRVVGPPPGDRIRTWRGSEWIGGPFGHEEGDSYVLSSEGTVHRRVDFDRGGLYRVRITGHAQQAGPQPASIGVQINGQIVREWEIPEPTSEPFQRTETVTLARGEVILGVSFLNDYYQPNAPQAKDRDRNLIVDSIQVEGPMPEPGWPTPAWQRILAAGNQPDDPAAQSPREIRRRIASQLATLAYRRPATTDEVEQLLGTLDGQKAENNLEADLQQLVTAVLVAPQFLFRIEPGPDAEEKRARELDGYELATRLSYFLWSSMPDDWLFTQAGNGNLRTPSDLQAAARRMLEDPKSNALVENFADQWLQLRQLASLQRDRQQFPQFQSELIESMRTETHLFVASIFHEDRSVLDLLDADYTFVDARLAELYGIEPVPTAGFQRVSLRDTPRRGILTQAAVLNITSLPTRTSPVLRGKWILDNLLLDPPPPPSPETPQLPEASATGSAETVRQRLAQHRALPECSVCHNRMDPLGFALDQFDAIGAWRDTENGQPLDVSGQLPDGTVLDGVDTLRTVLRNRFADQFVRCLAEKLFIYALGRGPLDSDECALREIVAYTRAHGDRFSAIVEAIVASDAFRKQGAVSTMSDLP